MQKLESNVVLSPTDLANHLACKHLSWLNYHSLYGGARPSKNDDELTEILQQYGAEHEATYFAALSEQLAAVNRTIVNLDIDRDMDAPYSVAALRDRAALTAQSLSDGPNALYQPTFFSEDGGIAWVGRADFLVPTDVVSLLGNYSFEPEDTKLARIAKVNAVLQLCSYAEQLTKLQGTEPEFIHVVTGSAKEGKVTIRLSEVSAYFRHVKKNLQQAVIDKFEGPSEPVPVENCNMCRWNKDCAQWWRERDHLSYVAGLLNGHRETLVSHGITTLAQLATSPDDLSVPEFEDETLHRLRRQAQLQYNTRVAKQTNPAALPETEFILPIKDFRGFNMLPTPNAGDLFYDIEGHPYRGDEGLEYLHGFSWKEADGSLKYHEIWAHTPEEERQALLDVIAFINKRRSIPGFEEMRVYHFGHYEPSALRRLSTRYATAETELNSLIRQRVFCDLSRVVTQAMRIGVESYSIKKLEQLYVFNRTDLVADGGLSIVFYEKWLQSINNGGFGPEGDTAVLRELADYNMNDCYSTDGLRDWLEIQRARLVEQLTDKPLELEMLSRPPLRPDLDEDISIGKGLVAQLNQHRFDTDLTEEQTLEYRHRWLMADLLDFHKREQAVDTYEFINLLSMEHEELYDSPSALAGLKFVREIETGTTKSKKWGFKAIRQYKFDPAQITKIGLGSSLSSSSIWPPRLATEDNGPTGEIKIVDIDLDNGTIDLDVRGATEDIAHPESVFEREYFSKKQFEEALEELAKLVKDDKHDSYAAAHDILGLHPPRFRDNFDIHQVSESINPDPLQIAEAIHHLDNSYLVIQGPPGTGKTYSSANAILALIKKGHRVGITANTHAAAHQLLREITKFAKDHGFTADEPLRICVKPKDGDAPLVFDEQEVAVKSVKDAKKISADAEKFDVIVGTSFLFSNESMRNSVDTLIIDEAGQLSLADSLAVSLAARNTVLVGDPQQLKQPTRAAHPSTSGLSGLEHINQGHDVVPPNYGVLLRVTRRMHPLITEFISEQVYEGKLGADDPCALQTIGEGGIVQGSGLRWVPVVHENCSVRSVPEVKAVVKIYESVLGRDFTDKFGKVRPITPRDIFVIAPYNAQVQELRRQLLSCSSAITFGLTEDLLRQRVGTVDKAQGSEAPIVLVSYTSSSADDVPRNFEFLYSKNRFNVAVSRAQAITVVVASPELLNVNCKTIEQVRLANMLCRYAEMATTISL
jgi:uncharacterized protein